MPAKIKVGIVGATVTTGGSGWGANAHVPALNALPEYELWAVCTAHKDTAQASAAQFGAELAFDNFDEMVAQPDIDLVVVSVRVPGHNDLVMKALEAGKAVFCEKPISLTVEGAREMIAAVERAGWDVTILGRGDHLLDHPDFRRRQSRRRCAGTGEPIIERTRALPPAPGMKPTGRHT